MHHRLLLLLVAAVVLTGLARARSPTGSKGSDPPRNRILFIGDGFGVNSFALAYLSQHIRKAGRGADQPLAMESLIEDGNLGLMIPYPDLDELVIESAGAATTMASGVRVKNDRVGIDTDGQPLRPITEDARAEGLAVGIVTTTSILHATPAAFSAHVSSRSRYLEIAEQLVSSGIDVFLGGGIRYFIPENRRVGEVLEVSELAGSDENGARKDGRDLLQEARALGYTLVSTAGELEKLTTDLSFPQQTQVTEAQEPASTRPSSSRNTQKLLGLFAASHPPMVLDRRHFQEKGVPDLDEMVLAALKILSQDPDGFLLIVEAGKIDFAGHNNDAGALLWEIQEFDDAIAVALDFARRDGKTLLVVTADHETGGVGFSYRDVPVGGPVRGFAPPIAGKAYKKVFANLDDLERILQQKVSFQVMASEIEADPRPDRIHEIVLKYTGISLTNEELRIVASNKPWAPFFSASAERQWQRPLLLGLVLSDDYGVTWSSKNHTSCPVMLMGYGPGSDRCRGILDNTAVYGILKQGLDRKEPAEPPEP